MGSHVLEPRITSAFDVRVLLVYMLPHALETLRFVPLPMCLALIHGWSIALTPSL